MAIAVQAGHVNIQDNCDHSLQSGTGAPGEASFTAAIAGMVAGAIQAHGISCSVWDANANCDERLMSQDYDAVVAIHAQHVAGSNNFGVTTGNTAEDGAAVKSAELRNAIAKSYASVTSLTETSPGWEDTVDEKEYYLFRALSKNTPFALIECGNINGDGTSFIEQNHGKVAEGIVNGILAYMDTTNIPTPASETTPNPSQTPSMTPVQEKLLALCNQLMDLVKEL